MSLQTHKKETMLNRVQTLEAFFDGYLDPIQFNNQEEADTLPTLRAQIKRNLNSIKQLIKKA